MAMRNYLCVLVHSWYIRIIPCRAHHPLYTVSITSVWHRSSLVYSQTMNRAAFAGKARISAGDSPLQQDNRPEDRKGLMQLIAVTACHGNRYTAFSMEITNGKNMTKFLYWSSQHASITPTKSELDKQMASCCNWSMR